MKIITTTRPVKTPELKAFLDKNLNALFEKQRQLVMEFNIEEDGDAIEITNDANYDSFLFRIELHGTEMHIIKSEHYTDDVNVLTLEDIMNNLLLEYPGRENIDFIGEGS